MVRHTLLVLALAGLMLALDAALAASVTGSSISILVLGGIVFAFLLARLATWVMRGGLRTRLLAAFGVNVLGLIPAIVMLPVVMSWPDPAAARVGSRVVIIWLLAIVVWTTSVLASVTPLRFRRPRHAAAPARRPPAPPQPRALSRA